MLRRFGYCVAKVVHVLVISFLLISGKNVSASFRKQQRTVPGSLSSDRLSSSIIKDFSTVNKSNIKKASAITTVKQISRGGDSQDDDGDEGESSIGGKATMTTSVFNLVNNVAGAGILTLSAGMASGTGWIPAILICAILGAIGGHCFAIIGDACELTGEEDFKVREKV